MPSVIVPVGLSLGQDFATRDPVERPSQYWHVRLGDDVVHLSMEETTAWGAAFLDPQAHADLRVTRTSLERHLQQNDIGPAGRLEGPEKVVAGLLDRDLLVEFDPTDGALHPLFSRLRLCPLVQGIGNSPEDPSGYQIGIAGEPLVTVDANVFAIWSYGLTEQSLWDACTGLAEGVDADLPEGEEPLGLTADGLAGDVGAAIPALVAGGCAFLDPVGSAR
ncbi:MAG: hypothetical protein ACRDMV_03710 [Streptosporangiales bacterium]